MKSLKTLALVFSLSLLSLNGFAASKVHLDHADTDIMDRASLQNGAKLFMNYCSGCHAISFMRYNRIGSDLGLSDELIAQNLMFAGNNQANQWLLQCQKMPHRSGLEECLQIFL